MRELGSNARMKALAPGGFQQPVLEFPNKVRRDINVSIPIPADWDGTSQFKLSWVWSTPETSGLTRWQCTYSQFVEDVDAFTTTPLLFCVGGAFLVSPSTTPNGIRVQSITLPTFPSNTKAMRINIARRDDCSQPAETNEQVVRLHAIVIGYN